MKKVLPYLFLGIGLALPACSDESKTTVETEHSYPAVVEKPATVTETVKKEIKVNENVKP